MSKENFNNKIRKTVDKEMKKNNSVLAEESLDNQKTDSFLMYLIIIILGATPLLFGVYVSHFISPAIDMPINYYTNFVTDTFSSYKFFFLLFMTSVTFALFIYSVYVGKKTIKSNLSNILLYIMMCFALLSIIVSEYKYFSLFGIPERREGLFTILACLLLAFIANNIKSSNKSLRYMVYALIPVTIINAVFGVLYIAGVKVLSNPTFAKFMLAFANTSGGTLQIAGTSYFIGTLSHGNYTSGMGSILYSIFLVLALWAKDSMIKYACFILSIVSGIIVFSSLSLSGMVTILFTVILISGIILIFNQKLFRIKILAMNIVIMAVVFIVLNFVNSDVSKELINELLAYILVGGLALLAFAVIIMIKYPQYVFHKYKYYTLAICIILLTGVILSYPKIGQRFEYELDRINTEKIIAQTQQDEFNLPEPGLSLGTGRFYIWKQTIKLIAEKPLTGYGWDTLSFKFPQNDPAKIVGFYEETTIVDKPHNMYLEVAYSMGIPSLVILLSLMVIYIMRFIKKISNKNLDMYPFNLAIFIGFLAFSIQALFNDANIGYQQFFFIFLGLGLSQVSDIRIFGHNSKPIE